MKRDRLIPSLAVVSAVLFAAVCYVVFFSTPVRPRLEYSGTDFVIEGENLRILLENGFAEKVQLGREVTYVSIPRYFWDGYAMPIVELVVDGEILLSFGEGKANLLNFIRGD